MSEQPPARARLLSRTVGALLTARILRGAWRARHADPPPPPTPADDRDPRRRDLPDRPRIERLVAALLALAGLAFFGFLAVYVDGADTQLLGLCAGLALTALAAACIVAGKAVVPQETAIEQRDVLLEPERVREVTEIVRSGGEGVSRRGLIAAGAGVAGAGLLTAAATPIASLGPRLDGTIHQTPWRRGVRLVDAQGRPLAAADITVGSFYTALPEGGDSENLGAGLLVVRLPAELIHLPPARRGWAPEGVLAYSKICPHAACAISLYRYPTYGPTSSADPAFTCPCHYSTFLPGEGGRLTFGPAGRALPQLPLMIDAQGYLCAADAFHEDIGPSWWNVRRSQS